MKGAIQVNQFTRNQAIERGLGQTTARVVLSAALMLTAAGCAVPAAPPDNTRAEIESQFQQSQNRINTLMLEVAHAGGLSGVAQHEAITVSGDAVTVQWQGNAEPLLRKLAQAKGMQFEANGRALPLPISIDMTNKPFVQVLENVGVQLGGRADVVLKAGEIELRYNGA